MHKNRYAILGMPEIRAENEIGIFGMFELAERHKKFSEKLYNEVMNQPESVVTSKASAEAKELYNLNLQVAREFDKRRSFLRLEVSKHGILYASFECEHEIEDLVLNHFMNRFPNFVMVLESQRGCFIGSHKLKKRYFTKEKLNSVLDNLERTLPVNSVLEGMNEFDENVWNNYYSSQYINQRKNIKLFLKMMPKKYHAMDKITKSFGNRNLGEYL